MIVNTIELPSDYNEIELHIFADEHIGDANCDIQHLKNRIEYVKNTPNAICILNGDIVDYSSRTSISDIESRQLNIMEQLECAIDLFGGIKDKIAIITSGNHEARSYKKEGIDFSKIFAQSIGKSDCYTPASAVLFIKFGKERNHGRDRFEKRMFSVFVSHGAGGGKREGSKINSLADMAAIVDTDIYIHSHSHLPAAFKESFYRINYTTKSVAPVTKLFVNTASNLNYGGYGEAALFKPNSKDYPVVHLQAKPKRAFAIV